MSIGRYTSAIVKFYARVPGQKDKNRNFVFLSGCLQLKNMVPGGIDDGCGGVLPFTREARGIAFMHMAVHEIGRFILLHQREEGIKAHVRDVFRVPYPGRR